MADIALIGVPFDGYGRPGHQAEAAAVLRSAGLRDAWSRHTVVSDDDLELPAPVPDRGRNTSLMNETALIAMVDALDVRIPAAVAAGRFPCVVGADCTTLLGTIPALSREGIGLLFVDGHEDTMPLDVSEDGEAANTEIGLLLGVTGGLLRGTLADRLPALRRSELAILGPRDVEWRRQFNVGSLRDAGVWLRACHELARAPQHCAREAVRHLKHSCSRWWLHVDLDVLDPSVFNAQGLPDVEDIPGGLTWDQLTQALTAAVSSRGCVGFSMTIYDPDQDPDRSQAQRITSMVAEIAAALP
ncbi:arginase family protein [Nocardia cyriacigeorgica]|uniref:Arginase family protein n=1 Tax=Nocardia cyriacigeorgica TaxID=135487 RepID=A0ABX0CIV6_9NOCA|nr:arginase family protein [Nocardia cyriacigeorgica]NEW56173.1 arginase family protein [Nocardia cyriacigeorgica]